MACARCRCGVYQTEDIISLNKIWHKCCFTCYRCETRLDKCTAKIFQGEVFCESCYKCLLEGLELFSSPSKPCRVASSPSCSCEKNTCDTIKLLPPFETRRKCEICFLAKQKLQCTKISRSCSCIPDRKTNSCKTDIYCFSFPIPREVANYYSRVHTMPKNTCPLEHTCCRPRKPNSPPRMKMRSISQKPSCNCRQNNTCRCRSRRPNPPSYQPPSGNNCPPLSCCCRPKQPSRCCAPPPQLPTPPPPPPPTPCCCCFPPCYHLQPEPEEYCCQNCYCPPAPPPPPPPPRCKAHCCPPRPSCPRRCRSPTKKKVCSPCCPNVDRIPECTHLPSSPPPSPTPSPPPPQCRCYQEQQEKSPSCTCKIPKYCSCGNLNPCNCKICQVREICTPVCNRCGLKVYAAEKISVSRGAYHTSCFSCFCCHKLLDVKNVYENCGEIYCKQCYNNSCGNQFYGYGSSQF